MDGANAAISFVDGKLTLQSRGHILTGGSREKLFERLWPWAYERQPELQDFLGNRYILFGEWLYAKNRIFYDALPDIFIAFDMYDKEENYFMSSEWRAFLPDTIKSSHVLWVGRYDKAPPFSSLIGPSNYQSDKWRKRFNQAMRSSTGKKFYEESETDRSGLMEGIYVKVEKDGKVIGRMKRPRPDFEKVRTQDRLWGRRPLLPNLVSR